MKIPDTQASNNKPKWRIHERRDLAAFHTIQIQSSYSSEGYCFRVTVDFLAGPPISANGIVAYGLTQNRARQSFHLKFELTHDLSQCGFSLLGTPWLACTSSERLQRNKAGDRSIYVLRVNNTT